VIIRTSAGATAPGGPAFGMAATEPVSAFS